METMIKIKDINSAMETFEYYSNKQAESTEQGDYKAANKCYNSLIKTVNFLKNTNEISSLEKYFSSPSIGVRLWAASYLLPLKEPEALKVLEEITKGQGIHSLTAETTLKEWKKGNLKF